MTKQLLSGLEARQKLKQGIEKVANAVKITLGPNVDIYQLYDKWQVMSPWTQNEENTAHLVQVVKWSE